MAIVWDAPGAYGDLKDFGVREAQISVAVIKTGAVINVKFKFSGDGVTWPADADAVQVGTIATLIPLELVVLRSGEIEIFNGSSIVFRSQKSGVVGSWISG